jgi:hypothetical protein
VNQGAIVLAPFDALCKSDSLGPCSTLAARELSAFSKGIAITYSASMPTPQLLPTGQLRGSELLNISSSSLLNSPQAMSAVTTSVVANEPAVSSPNAAKASQTQADAIGFAQVNQILSSTTSQSTLVWGRWAGSSPQDNFSISFINAMQGRAVTIGDGNLFLFRSESNVPNLISIQQGNVNFSLQGSQAVYLDVGNNPQAAAVTSGSLGINFSTLNFNTSLSLVTTPGAGTSAIAQTLQASGQLNPNTGIFLSNPNNNASAGSAAAPTVAGAVSLDTRQSGYVFTLPAGSGQFKGATLWGR